MAEIFLIQKSRVYLFVHFPYTGLMKLVVNVNYKTIIFCTHQKIIGRLP